VALTFSSTIIIVKLLSDKRELDSLHGRIAVGFLIVQDIAVVIAMMAMSALRGADGAQGWEVAVSLLVRVAGAGAVLFLVMRYLLPSLVRVMARSQELLLVFAIAWDTGLAALGEWAGFSKEAGAFLAGFSLASTSYREAIGARLAGIRDFLLLFFFIDLGPSWTSPPWGARSVRRWCCRPSYSSATPSSSWPSWATWATASAPASWRASPWRRSASSPSSSWPWASAWATWGSRPWA
jgi:predicted Kef-type K+ transport protein